MPQGGGGLCFLSYSGLGQVPAMGLRSERVFTIGWRVCDCGEILVIGLQGSEGLWVVLAMGLGVLGDA